MKPKHTKPKQLTREPADLAEARQAMSALLSQLPEPRLGEWMTASGVTLPRHDVLTGPNVPPILENPRALLEELGPYAVATLPPHWLPAHRQHQQRWIRSTQLLRFHAACLVAEAGDGLVPELTLCDAVVAGLVFLLVRPQLSQLRQRLLQAVCEPQIPLGAYLAVHAKLLPEEQSGLLPTIATDSRLASALCRRDPARAASLLQSLLARHDVWAATVVLSHSKAQAWLNRVLSQAEHQPDAAVTALTLQPGVGEALQQRWLGAVLTAQPSHAYQAARWTRATWPPERWKTLRDTLRPQATSDLACSWFLWHRDVEPDQSDQALRDDEAQIIWVAELIKATKSQGQALRRRCVLRLRSNRDDREAKLALRWLEERGRGR